MATNDIRVIKDGNSANFFVREITAREYVGRPFEIEVELLHEDFTLTFTDYLGAHLTFELDINDNLVRYYDGIVTRFSYERELRGLACYRAILRPWLWLLTHNVQTKVQYVQSDQAASAGSSPASGSSASSTPGTVPNIIKGIFDAASFSDYEFKLQNSYRVLDYCVQYQESDFDFVSRLMEQEGIYYFFSHKSGKHTLTLADDPNSHATFDSSLTSIAFTNREHSARATDLVYDWSASQEIQPGKLTIRDYDFTKPNANLDKVKTKQQGHTYDNFEIYEYPGHYTEASDGETYAGIRMDERIADFARFSGRSNARWLAPGFLFTLEKAARDGDNQKYLVLEAVSNMLTDRGGDEKRDFRVSFGAMPSSVTYRPPRVTQRPLIRGPQTAIVVGPSGQEIYTDKFARVKVQFPWDRYGGKDENSSCWVRCAQAWAGKQWGFLFIPRIGQEVIVHFMEGDPDHPIITGAVYNGPDDQPSPITLPDNATQSTIKSNSSTGGGGFNQIRLEDKAGSEEFFIHAAKDMTIEVLNNRTTTITQDDAETISKGNRTLTVSQGNETKEISQGNQSLKVAQGSQTIEVSQGDRTLTVGTGKYTATVAADTALTVQNGNYSVSVSSGKASITAAQSITLTVGSNSITIDTSGVTISASKIALSATGEMDLEATGNATLKGAMVAIN